MTFALGLVLGVVATAGAVYLLMPRLMLRTRRSRLPVEETVARICEEARKEGWSVPKVYDMKESLEKGGHPIGEDIRIISLCKPVYARQVLGRDEYKKMSAIMPCRIGVYRARDGSVYVAQMNTGLMGRMFGSFIATVMGRVSEEEHRFLAHVTE